MKHQRFGASLADGGTHFAVWSDKARKLCVNWRDVTTAKTGTIELSRSQADPKTFEGFVDGLAAGALYDVIVDGKCIVDPYARELPHGVHGPARVVADPSTTTRPPKRRLDFSAGEVLYELHIGTFTPDGTLSAAAKHLKRLAALGVTAVEMMPVASFPGTRGWGYDGVALFSTYAPYGTVRDLGNFIDTAHSYGLSVILDVVYNHLGPDGNYLPALSDEYFDSGRDNPWGKAPAFEKPAYRRYVTDNARYWLEEVGFDGLRLDATHEIEPGGEPHLLRALAEVAHACSPPGILIAEDDRNDPAALFAHGIDAVWSDDFHHSLHVLLTDESDGYYAGYEGSLRQLARVIERGQLYEGQVFPVTNRPRGRPIGAVPRERLIYSTQNHDQVGNRAFGERLHRLCDPTRLRALTALSLLLPATPLLFMGQEWAEESPFLYFTDQAGPMGEAVTAGRREEFAHFAAFRDGDAETIPDPQDESSFFKSKLRGPSEDDVAGRMLELHHELLKLRRDDAVLAGGAVLSAGNRRDVLWVTLTASVGRRLILVNLGPEATLDAVAGISFRDCQLLWSTEECDRKSSRLQLPASSCSLFSVSASARDYAR